MEKSKIKSQVLRRVLFSVLCTIGITSLTLVYTKVYVPYTTHTDAEPEPSPIIEVVPKVKFEPKGSKTAIVTAYQRARNSRLPIEIADLQAGFIVSVSEAEGIPLPLLIGIIETESSTFNALARSSAGAVGLMQILTEDKVSIDTDRQYDIEYNLLKGCEILKSKLKKNDNSMQKALFAYSGGSKGYVEKVYASVGRFTIYADQYNMVDNTKSVATNP